MKIGHIPLMIAILLFTGLYTGCQTVQDILYDPMSESDLQRLRDVRKTMLDGNTIEVQVDQKIADAVEQMAMTLKPEYRNSRMGKFKLGFLEITDIDRNTVTQMHNYVTEKALTFSYLEPTIAENFSIVERFLLKDVIRELRLENVEEPERYIDQELAQRLGRIYHLDVIETGITVNSPDFLDINLRMIETRRGRIIAVGSVKIHKTEPVRRWLQERGETGFDLPGLY